MYTSLIYSSQKEVKANTKEDYRDITKSELKNY